MNQSSKRIAAICYCCHTWEKYLSIEPKTFFDKLFSEKIKHFWKIALLKRITSEKVIRSAGFAFVQEVVLQTLIDLTSKLIQENMYVPIRSIKIYISFFIFSVFLVMLSYKMESGQRII